MIESGKPEKTTEATMTKLIQEILLLFSLAVITSSQNCGNTITLSPGNACDCGTSSVDISKSCQNLSELLVAYNRVVPEGDCLELILEPGVYTLTSYTTSVNYSTIITAPRGGVDITCQSQCSETATFENVFSGSPLAFHKNTTSRFSFVILEGITFQDCLLPLQFDDLDNATISDCTFRNFSASAVDLFNCLSVTINNCHFDNSTSSLAKAQFRANSGGLSIAYHTEDPSLTNLPQISITDSTFTSNRVLLPSQNSSQQINLALNDHYYFGRGGGLGIFVDESFTNITVEIVNCNFSGNYAESFGGGLYLYVDGNETHHDFTVANCNFAKNSAGPGSFGGGLQVAMLIRNLNSPPCNFTFSNCYFTENVADFGGGLSTVQVFSQGEGNMVSVSGTHFVKNTGTKVGSAVMFASLLYVQSRVQSLHYRVKDCTFQRNVGPGGTFGAGFIHVNFEGNNTFESNRGPGLRMVGSLIGVRDRLSFIGNDAENFEGGALYISAFGQVKLYSGSQVDFINNTGRIGSAIVVNVQRSSIVFSELIFNPQCFLLHENTTLPPNEWNDVKVRFQGNRARVGPTVYISHLDLCSWFSVEVSGSESNQINATFSIESFTQWPVFDYTNNSNTAQAHNSTSSDFYFQTEAVSMSSENKTDRPVVIRPGQTRRLNLVGIDQLGHPTYIIIRMSDSRANINSGAFSQAGNTDTSNTNDTDIIRFEPALLPIQPSDELVNISYGFPNLGNQLEFHTGENIPIIVDTPYNVRGIQRFNFTLQFANCQLGYEIRRRVEGDSLLTCSCVDTDFDVLTCDDEAEVIVLRDGLWAGSEEDPVPHVDVYPCPTTYCSCQRRDGQICETLFFQSDPNQDRQCHANRRGTLCGDCVNGTGVGVLRTNCRECSGEAYYALGFLIVADIIIPILILLASVKFRYSFPHSLKGLIFYIQTVYYVTEYFPISFWDARRFMLYLGSLLGLYFPWDFCLRPGMDALLSLGLKFLPPLIVSVVVVASLLTVYYWLEKRARKRIWHGIWALVLLMYAPLVHTCTSLLHCPAVPGSSEEEDRRWFLNGEVACFSDAAHSGLGAVAIIVLMLLSLLIPAVFFFTLLGKSPRVQAYSLFERMYEALVEGYEERVRWWGAWDLLRRLLIITLVVALPGRTLAPLFIIIPAFAGHVFLLPYKKLWQNVIEAALLINYTLLLLLRATQTFLDNLSLYSGTSVPRERGEELAATDNLTWLFTPFFYLPVLFAVVFCCVQAIYRVTRRAYYKRRPRVGSDFAVINTGYNEFGANLPNTLHPNVTVTELNVQTIY